MASISKDQLRSAISGVLKAGDLSQLSSKKVRRQLEEKFGCDLTDRKQEIDKLVMAGVEEIQRNEEEGSANENQEEEDDEEDEDEEGSSSDEDFSAPEDMGPPRKKAKKGKDSDAALAKKLQKEEDAGGRRTRHASKPGRKTPSKSKSVKRSGYHKLLTLSPELAELMGETEMARSDVVKRMWQIIKERNLADPSNRQFIICDDQLLKIFGEERIRPFGMMKYLKNHMSASDSKNDSDGDSGNEDENGDGGSDSDYESSRNKKSKGKAKKGKSGYHAPVLLSPALSDLMQEKEMPRSEVVKRMWAIIKERNLADPKNKQFMLCDAQLYKIFGVKRVRTFGMMKYLKDHMFTSDQVVDNS